MADPPEHVIMERDFQTLDANGNAGTIRLRIGQPYLKPEANTWCCPVQLTGSGIDHTINALGQDSVETVHNILRMAKTMLEYYSQKQNLKITWHGGEDLGLWVYPPHETPSQNEDVSTFDFEEAFNEFFRTFGKE